MLPRLSCPPLPCGPPGLQALAWHGLASTCFAGELPGGGGNRPDSPPWAGDGDGAGAHSERPMWSFHGQGQYTLLLSCPACWLLSRLAAIGKWMNLLVASSRAIFFFDIGGYP